MSVQIIINALLQNVIELVDTCGGVEAQIGRVFVPLGDTFAFMVDKKHYEQYVSSTSTAHRIWHQLHDGIDLTKYDKTYCIDYIRSMTEWMA